MTNTTNQPPEHVDARVIQTPFGFLVKPPDVFKRAGNEFILLNLSDFSIDVSFDKALRMDPASDTIAPKGFGRFTIGDATPGVYDYQVAVTLAGVMPSLQLFASGESDPHIIIDF